MALETPRPEIGPSERTIPLTTEEKNLKQNLELALSVGNYYNAATDALKLAKTRPDYIETADSCASHLYHDQ